MVSICGSDRLAACLAALAGQRNAPSFEIVVAGVGARLGGERLRSLHRNVIWVSAPPSPPLLAAAAVGAARGAIVLLTEDHCEPGPDWVRRLHAAVAGSAGGPGPGAAGGPVAFGEAEGAGLEWAFHFSDFAAHVPPVAGGAARSLSVCNVAYRRATLERLRTEWGEALHETRLHDAIRRRVGPLVMVPDAPVVSWRRVRLADALRERYGLGRIYAAVRFEDAPARLRWLRALATPALPPLLMVRLARRSRRIPEGKRRLLLCLPQLAGLVLAWSLGEAVGLLTGRAPLSVRMAPEPARAPAAPAARA